MQERGAALQRILQRGAPSIPLSTHSRPRFSINCPTRNAYRERAAVGTQDRDPCGLTEPLLDSGQLASDNIDILSTSCRSIIVCCKHDPCTVRPGVISWLVMHEQY